MTSKPTATNDSEYDSSFLDEELYNRHTELKTMKDFEEQRGTPIPMLFSQYYKFVQNPSSVTVETFKRMIDTDDTIGSGVDFLTTCLAARLGTYQHKSKEITEYVNAALGQIQGGFFNAVKELLSATWAGYAVQEKVWANDPNFGFIVKRLVTLPPSTVLFECERTGEITSDGIMQYQRGFNPASITNSVGLFGFGPARPDAFAKFGDFPYPLRTANPYNYMSIRIPKQKCIHYAFDAQGKFGNPYGRSLLRRCYKYYVSKDAVLSMLMTTLNRKGTPLTMVFSDPSTTVMDQNNPAVQAGTSVRGQQVGISAMKAAHTAFTDINNKTVIHLPGKEGQIYTVKTLDQGGASAGDTFLPTLDFCNKSILRSLLIPTLIFGNGDGTGSYSLGQEHARTFNKILDGWLSGLTLVLLEQLVEELLKYNFPESAWRKDGLGDFTKREMTQEEKDKEADMFQKGVDMGAIDMNELADLNKIRDSMGFEPRDTPIEREDLFDEEETGEKDVGEEPQTGKRSADKDGEE